jgi:hypothetical protein
VPESITPLPQDFFDEIEIYQLLTIRQFVGDEIPGKLKDF